MADADRTRRQFWQELISLRDNLFTIHLLHTALGADKLRPYNNLCLNRLTVKILVRRTVTITSNSLRRRIEKVWLPWPGMSSCALYRPTHRISVPYDQPFENRCWDRPLYFWADPKCVLLRAGSPTSASNFIFLRPSSRLTFAGWHHVSHWGWGPKFRFPTISVRDC